MKKPRSDSKLLNLPPEKMAWLADQLLGGLPQHKVLALLEKEHHVKSSNAALSRFFDAVCVPIMLERRHLAVAQSRAVLDDAKKHPGQFSQATVESLEALATRLVNSPNPDPKEVAMILGTLIDFYKKAQGDQKIEAQREALKLAREKFEAAMKRDAATREVLGNEELTPEQKEARIKQVFGIS